jgi:hypothetical protein
VLAVRPPLYSPLARRLLSPTQTSQPASFCYTLVSNVTAHIRAEEEEEEGSVSAVRNELLPCYDVEGLQQRASARWSSAAAAAIVFGGGGGETLLSHAAVASLDAANAAATSGCIWLDGRRRPQSFVVIL